MSKVKAIYLRTARERKRLTQVELASISHVAQNTISRLEIRADTVPSFPTMVALAAALDVKPLDLRWGPDPARQVIRRRRRVVVRRVTRRVA